MNIQWYPGHMHKASKEMKAVLPTVDLVIEILDARLPFSSQNPLLAAIRGDKPCIKILNKSDLADQAMTQHWQAYLEQTQGVKTLALTARQPEKIRQLLPALVHKMVPGKTTNHQVIQALIMGIPNVGKSTIINILAGRIIAKTGNEPAITKMQQRINLGDNIVLLDTPGVLWPNIENPHSGFRLAASGGIKDTAIDHSDIAYFTAGYLLKYYPDALKARFQFETLPHEAQVFLEHLGQRRGCLNPGGNVNLDKVAKILLTELRTGNLGQITLETPAMMEEELAELLVARALKAERQKARKQKRQG